MKDFDKDDQNQTKDETITCFGGGRAPRVRLARPDVHGYGSGWVWLGASLLLVLAG